VDKKDQDFKGRRSLLTTMGIAAATGIAVSAASSTAQAQHEHQHAGFMPARHSQDAWMDELAGDHRVFIDSSTRGGGANALRYGNNILTAHGEDYAGADSDYAMVICYRHASTVYGFNDEIWAKYGAGMGGGADPVPTSNPMNVPTPGNGQNSNATLIARGVQFAICSRATRSLSRRLATRMGIPSEQILEELRAGAIPNSRFVPAGVVAVTRAQEYGYSLLYAE